METTVSPIQSYSGGTITQLTLYWIFLNKHEFLMLSFLGWNDNIVHNIYLIPYLIFCQ